MPAKKYGGNHFTLDSARSALPFFRAAYIDLCHVRTKLKKAKKRRKVLGRGVDSIETGLEMDFLECFEIPDLVAQVRSCNATFSISDVRVVEAGVARIEFPALYKQKLYYLVHIMDEKDVGFYRWYGECTLRRIVEEP